MRVHAIDVCCGPRRPLYVLRREGGAPASPPVPSSPPSTPRTRPRVASSVDGLRRPVLSAPFPRTVFPSVDSCSLTPRSGLALSPWTPTRAGCGCLFLFLSFLLSPGRRTRRPPALSVPTSGSHCQSVTDSRCPALCRRNKGVPCWWSCPRRASAQSPRGRVPPICRHEVKAGVRGARHGRRGKGAAAPR